MEETIKQNLCNLCNNNKCKNCMRIKYTERNGLLIYKCINYIPNGQRPQFYDFNYEIKSNKEWR